MTLFRSSPPPPPPAPLPFHARVGAHETWVIDALYMHDGPAAYDELVKNLAHNRMEGWVEPSARGESWRTRLAGWAFWRAPQGEPEAAVRLEVDGRAAWAARQNERDIKHDKKMEKKNKKQAKKGKNEERKIRVDFGGAVALNQGSYTPSPAASAPYKSNLSTPSSTSPIFTSRTPRQPRADYSCLNLAGFAYDAHTALGAPALQVFPTLLRTREAEQAPVPVVVVDVPVRSGRLYNPLTARRPTQAPAVVILAPRTRTRSASSRYSVESDVDPAMDREGAKAKKPYVFV